MAEPPIKSPLNSVPYALERLISEEDLRTLRTNSSVPRRKWDTTPQQRMLANEW